jgi:hypothetical protein
MPGNDTQVPRISAPGRAAARLTPASPRRVLAALTCGRPDDRGPTPARLRQASASETYEAKLAMSSDVATIQGS